MQSLTTITMIVVESYLFYLGQIAIHNCVHKTLFRHSKLWNQIVGHVLCSIQLMHFEGWRAAHLLHHRFTNTDKDPHHVDRPLLPYLLTHYYRIAKAVWNPTRFFRAVLPPILIAVVVVVWQTSIGDGLRGLRWVMQYWFIPTLISQVLVAHFNYIGHAGLPSGRGHDTRSFKQGLGRIVNRFTFNFYLHAEHHLSPGEAIPIPNPSIRNDQRRRMDCISAKNNDRRNFTPSRRQC